MLLDKGSNLEQILPNEMTPLVMAIGRGNMEMITALLDKGAEVERPAENGTTPLAKAIQMGSIAMVKFLLDRGANMETIVTEETFMSKKYWNALGVAIEEGRDNMVQFLLFYDVRIDLVCCINTATDKRRLSAVAFACEKANFKIIDMLVRHVGVKESMENLQNCRAVNCLNCGLESLPSWMGMLPDDVDLMLAGNPLSSIPSAVKEQGTKSILQYIRDVERGQASWKRAKVIVLGKEGVGKTHLYQRLRGNRSYNQNVSTDGIDIGNFVLNDMQLTWFDFGGQEVFYPTHQFFLTPQCVYLIVFRLNDTDYVDRVHYWLRNVRAFSRGVRDPARVLIVGTHADAVDRQVVKQNIWSELKPLMKEFGNITGYLEVSCKTGEGFGSLELGITKALSEAKLGTVEVPVYYVELFHWCREMKMKSAKISFESVCEAFEKYSDFQLSGACKFLTNMGEVLFIERLSMVILDLKWLADTFKALITFQNKWVKDGVVLKKELFHCWPKTEEEIIMENMRILERVYIAFPKTEEDKWVIPCMLSEARKSPDFEDVRYERIFRMEMIPRGVMGRLIVRMQCQGDIIIEDMWRSGMTFTHKGYREGEIMLRNDDIVIRSNASKTVQKASEECMDLLRSGRLVSPLYEYLIACPHCLAEKKNESERKLLRYDECVKMVVSNEAYFKCGETEVDVSLLGADVTFSFVHVFEKNAIRVEEESFACGSFGNIYKARMTGGKEEVVIVKELKSRLIEEGFEEFQHEVLMMSKLKHENLVELYGVMLNPLRMVIEFCEGGDLFQAIHCGRVEGAERSIALDIAKGMEFLHSQRPPVIHRDLKTQNILLTSGMKAKIADFGLATFVSEKINIAVGTTMTMAPELQRGDKYTETADIYSCGVVFFEIYRGPSKNENLFEELYTDDTTKKEVFEAIIHGNLRPSIPESAPGWMKHLIDMMWQHDALKRPSFKSCIEMIEAERAVLLEPRAAKSEGHVRVIMEDLDGYVPCMMESKHLETEQIWCGSGDGMLRGLNKRNFEEFKKEKAHEERINVLCCFEDYVVSGGKDGVLRIEKQETAQQRTPESPLKSWISSKVKSDWLPAKLKNEWLAPKSKEDEDHVVLIKPNAERGREIMGICLLEQNVVVAYYSGRIVLLSKDGKFLKETTLQTHVSCMCQVEQRVIVSSGNNLFEIFVMGEEMQAKFFAGIDQYTSFMVHLGYEEFLTCTLKGEMYVWSLRKRRLERCWNLERKIYCVSPIHLHDCLKLFVGLVNEIMIIDLKGRPERKLPMPREGDVICIQQIGVDCVWVSVRQKKDNKGSLY